MVGRQRGRTAAGSSKGPLPQGLSSCKAHAMPLWNCLGAGVGRIFKIDFPSLSNETPFLLLEPEQRVPPGTSSDGADISPGYLAALSPG